MANFTKNINGKIILCSSDIRVGDKVYGTILGGDNVYIVPDGSSEIGYNIGENRHGITLEEAQMMDGYKIIRSLNPQTFTN
jgi:hypothetical protein